MIYQEMHINFIIINNKSSILEVSNKGRNGNMRQITKKDEGCQSEFIQPSPQKHSSCYEDKSFNTNNTLKELVEETPYKTREKFYPSKVILNKESQYSQRSQASKTGSSKPSTPTSNLRNSVKRYLNTENDQTQSFVEWLASTRGIGKAFQDQK